MTFLRRFSHDDMSYFHLTLSQQRTTKFYQRYPSLAANMNKTKWANQLFSSLKFPSD